MCNIKGRYEELIASGIIIISIGKIAEGSKCSSKTNTWYQKAPSHDIDIEIVTLAAGTNEREI